MKLRPTPALVVAVLALVVAMAGTSYAAAKIGSAQIKNNSIKSADIKNRTIKAKDIKPGVLTSANIDRSCPATDVAVMGVCIDKTATGPSTYLAALQDCDAKSARLMSYQEFRILTGKPGVVWANGDPSQYEFLDYVTRNGGVNEANAVSFGGTNYGNDASGQNFWHRCVTYP